MMDFALLSDRLKCEMLTTVRKTIKHTINSQTLFVGQTTVRGEKKYDIFCYFYKLKKLTIFALLKMVINKNNGLE